jgi:hypothetical protein
MAAAWIEAGTAVAGLLGANSSQNAANQQNQQNLQFQEQMYNQQDPFSAGGNRAQYVPMLNSLATGGPNSIANDPMYQALNNQSMTNMNRQMAASGQMGSGQAMLALNQNSQQNQMNYWQQMMGTYGGLSGATGGRTSPMQGQSPTDAFNQSQSTQANFGGALGLLSQGISGIYGNMSSNPTSNFNNAYSGSTSGNTFNYAST